MRRLIVLSLVLLGADQVTKTLAQLNLTHTSQAQWRSCRDTGIDCARALADVVLAPGWGLTYTENPTLYVWVDAPPAAVYGAHLMILVVWAWLVLAARWYLRWHRASLPVDLAMALVTVAAWGNLIDRLLVGGARDWLASPWWVTNLADGAAWLSVAMIALELWRNPLARRLDDPGFTLDPRRWPPPRETASCPPNNAHHEPDDDS